MLESTRAQEAAVKKDLSEQLEAFRQQREAAEEAAKDAVNQDTPEATEVWSTGPRKRKKPREDAFGAVKLRRTASGGRGASEEAAQTVSPTAPSLPHVQTAKIESDTPEKKAMPSPAREATTSSRPAASATSLGLGLAAYSSDEDD